jgi:hypothetical protein
MTDVNTQYTNRSERLTSLSFSLDQSPFKLNDLHLFLCKSKYRLLLLYSRIEIELSRQLDTFQD